MTNQTSYIPSFLEIVLPIRIGDLYFILSKAAGSNECDWSVI